MTDRSTYQAPSKLQYQPQQLTTQYGPAMLLIFNTSQQGSQGLITTVINHCKTQQPKATATTARSPWQGASCQPKMVMNGVWPSLRFPGKYPSM